MATKQMKVCDVYGTTKGVKSYRVSMIEMTPGEADVEISPHTIKIGDVDLCPRAVDRCVKFIYRALNPPGAKE